MEVDATPHCPVGSVSSKILLVVTPGGDRVANMDIEHVEKDGSVAARGTKGNLRRWVVKKHVSHIDEVHMTRLVGFVATKKRVGEAYRLPAGGDNEDQVRSITAGGG